MRPLDIRIEDYTYNLPDDRIAKTPLAERSASRLLVYKSGECASRQFSEITELLDDSHLLVFNDSRVIHARLEFFKETGARIELFCLDPATVSIAEGMSSTGTVEWKCYIGNAKRWKSGLLTKDIQLSGSTIELSVELLERGNDHYIVRFAWANHTIAFGQLLDAAGLLPLPPYLNRDATEADELRYQTVYANTEGSVAAPTAGLHFTNAILNQLQANGVQQKRVTLHVGAGTFKPVTTELIGDHAMHSEPFSVSIETIESLVESTQSIIPVGTTSMRTLESLYWIGVQVAQGLNAEASTRTVTQWEPYDQDSNNLTRKEALGHLLDYMQQQGTNRLFAKTGIMIAPGYRFRVCDGLITNFHQPNSTLLLLVGALLGPTWREVYQFALDNDFRFLSYGDSSLLLP